MCGREQIGAIFINIHSNIVIAHLMKMIFLYFRDFFMIYHFCDLLLIFIRLLHMVHAVRPDKFLIRCILKIA